MIIENNNSLKNNVVKMFITNKDATHNEITRLGSPEQRSVNYRRNGMLNYGAQQMLAVTGDFDFYRNGKRGGSDKVG